MKRPIVGVWAVGLICGALAQGAHFGWDFEQRSTAPGGDLQGLAVGWVERFNNHGETTLLNDHVASSGYEGASGGRNAAAAARVGPLSWAAEGSAYFEFSVSPAPATHARLRRLSLGSRSTASGPRQLALYSSLDGFAAPLAPPAWVGSTGEWLPFEWVLDAEVVGETRFRLVGYAGAGPASPNIANWRIDDLHGELDIVDGALPAPRGLVAWGATADAFDCAWESVPGALGYRLRLMTIVTSGEWPDLIEEFVPVPGLEDRWVTTPGTRWDGLEPKTTYYWHVTAEGASGVGEPSEVAEMTTLQQSQDPPDGDPPSEPVRPTIQALEFVPTGGVAVAIDSRAGDRYQLESRSDGVGAQGGGEGWQAVGEPMDGTGERLWLPDPVRRPRCFYRVRVLSRS